LLLNPFLPISSAILNTAPHPESKQPDPENQLPVFRPTNNVALIAKKGNPTPDDVYPKHREQHPNHGRRD
jgi:hypothetical protein